ncbi:Flagellar motor rotation protein MotB [hydrothermal vent metagenome]|uniref:Flagellar motor rotation protein MotB n=1 Tax=hydrothermal vent metagenome TaxID=652676 RepID=A0A3B0ZI57_9ZZZZ
MSATATLGESTTPSDRSAEDHFPWELEAAPSVVDGDTWLLSFIDILTLLLALFVLLLAQEHQSNKAGDSEPTTEPARVNIAPETLPIAPPPDLFSVIRLPALPQIVTPLNRLRIPLATRSKKVVEPPQPLIAEITPELQENITAHSRMNDLLESLRSSALADRIDIQTRTDSVRLDIADSILFAPARTRLTDSGLHLLKDLSETLNTLPWSLSVEGHTDNVPIQTDRFPSNWELSSARATTVARELIRHGIRPERIRAIGYADTQPRAGNETPEGRNRNRRVTFVLELPEN